MPRVAGETSNTLGPLWTPARRLLGGLGSHLLPRLSPPTQGARRLGEKPCGQRGWRQSPGCLWGRLERPSTLSPKTRAGRGATLWDLLVKPLPREAELRQDTRNPWLRSQTLEFSRALGLSLRESLLQLFARLRGPLPSFADFTPLPV